MKSGMLSSTIKTGLGQFLGLVLGAISIKLLALLAGPAGVGLFSLLRNFQQTVSSVASLGGQNAIIQGANTRVGQGKVVFLLSSFYMFLIGALSLSCAVFLSATWIADWLFSGEHASAVRWLAIPIFMGTLLIYFKSLLVAEMQYVSLSAVNVFMGVGAVCVSVPVGIAYSEGYLNSLVLLLFFSLLPAFLASLFYVRRLSCFSDFLSVRFSCVFFSEVKFFFSVALPSLFSIVLTFGGVLFVRSYIFDVHGLDGAGYFDASWSISAMYMALFLVSLQSYLLPKLSGSKGDEASSVFSRACRFTLLISLPLIVVLITFKATSIYILFSSEFSPALAVLRWSLLGDFVRGLGLIFSTFLLARADMKGFVFAEVIWTFAFVATSVLFLAYGLEWVGVGYLLGYISYLFFLVIRVRAVHQISISASVWGLWFISGLWVVMVACFSWNDVELFSINNFLIVPTIFFVFLIMSNGERLLGFSLCLNGLKKAKLFLERKLLKP